MKLWIRTLVCLSAVLAAVCPVHGQRQMESLGRGVIAVRASSTQAYIGWRMLGTDPDDVSFNVYRVRNGITNQLNGSPLSSSCNYLDTSPNFSQANSYFVRAIIDNVEQPASASWTLPAGAATVQYVNIPLNRPAGGTSWDGVPYTYNANDCSAGDVDGDGEYEIILKWDPSNSHDNAHSGFTGNTILDCYKLNGTHLWRIDLGPNVRSGAHYTHFMVYDFDGNGRAELMCRTAPGARDGLSSYIGGASKWQNVNGPRPTFNDTDDYRFNNPNGVTNGYVLAGPEFLSVFDGETGEELATATYYPKRDPDFDNDNPTPSRLNSVWGDSYGNRLDRFLAGIAFCDGIRPTAIFCRGYYTRAYLAAWDWRGGQLSMRWTFNSNDGNPANLAYRGQGAHSLSIGDLDGDGMDEVTYGACAIDHDGTGLYSTGLGHGDAEHMSDMDPNRDGQEIWFVHESPSSYGPHGLELHDSATGEILFSLDGQNDDVGRGVAIDIDPRYPGYEMWGSRPVNPSVLANATGVVVPTARPGQINFACWWDADLLREILDGTTVSKWDWNSGSSSSALSPGGLSSNNGTKSTPALSADLFGDWREEVMWRTSDNLNLRLYTTTVVATNRFYTLMHDPQYRCAIAWQNTAYNQPPHPGFNIGPDMYPPPRPPVSQAQLAWRGGSGGDTWTAGNNWYANGVWTNDVVATYTDGNAVLFDLRGVNHPTVTLAGAIQPGEITVHSPTDFTFAGTGSLSGSTALVKAGTGNLTIDTTNNYTGDTRVSGGQLTVNGTLDGSAVVVEARGEPWGRARLSGTGRLGQGLTIEQDCGLIVGAGVGTAGVLTVSNALTELGGVLNQFDLSEVPGGPGNDRVELHGDLTLSGTNVIEITQLDGILGDGLYPLISYDGTLSGGLGNLVLAGDFLQPVSLTNPPGQIALLAVVPVSPPAAPTALSATPINAFQVNLAWTDNAVDETGFVIERSTDDVSFSVIAAVPADTTTHQDTPVLADTTYYYRVSATNLAGASTYATAEATTPATSPTLTWMGDGSDNIWDIGSTANWWDGTAVPYADFSHVVFNNTGSSSPAIDLVEPLAPGSVVVNASQDYTFSGVGSLDGSMTLAKDGSGDLTINTLNTFSGGTLISNGTVRLGSVEANSSGLGVGPITFYGGTLEFNGVNGSTSPEYGGNSNPLIVPAGQSGTILVPQRFQAPGVGGPLSGAGTLNFMMYYVRGTITGDLSAFTGQINAISSDGSDDFRLRNTAGMPAARLHLGNGINMYYQNSPQNFGPVVPIGELTGDPGAVISVSQTQPGNSSHGQPATWVVGGLNTDATFAGSIIEQTTIVKQGTGQWILTGNSSYSGTTTVGGGTLVINANNTGAPGDVTIQSGGTLAGTGVVGGETTVAGNLAPGTSMGTLTFVTNLTLVSGSTSLFEISKVPFSHDRAIVGATLTLGGTLTVIDSNPALLVDGDAFDLFDAAAIEGGFDDYDFPTLEAGLGWDTSGLSTDGILRVVAVVPPEITSVNADGGNLLVAGTGGEPDGVYHVLTSADLDLPLGGWTRVQTNNFGASGDFSFMITTDANGTQQFIAIEIP